jgi:hypothetical protein
MPSKILFLQNWKSSLLERAWIFAKVFLKEGVLYRQWDQVLRLGRKPHGSVRITEDLMQALERSGVTLLSRENSKQKTPFAVVFKDVRNLRWALKEKKAGRLSRLLAGPFVATMPFEYNSILLDPAIDGLIFLSSWHRELFLKEASRPPTLTYLWYSGVDHEKWSVPTTASRDQILLYIKNVPEEKVEFVKNELKRRNLEYMTICYGSYSPEEYYNALSRAKFVIFLQMSETQGLAVFESWSMDRPTLHWNPGQMPFLGKVYSGASSCPYLSPENGLDFTTWDDFSTGLDLMLQCWSSLHPRKQILEKYTWEHSAHLFKNILEDQGE